MQRQLIILLVNKDTRSLQTWEYERKYIQASKQISLSSKPKCHKQFPEEKEINWYMVIHFSTSEYKETLCCNCQLFSVAMLSTRKNQYTQILKYYEQYFTTV